MHPHSYHIFLWPFRFDYKKKRLPFLLNYNNKKYSNKLLSRKKTEYTWESVSGASNPNDFYSTWNYLSHKARAIFPELNPAGKGVKNAPCRILRLKLDSKAENSYSIICRDGNKYTLELTKIELHVYGFGCGVLFFYTENYSYNNIADIKKIADFGRRLLLPFIPKTEKSYSLTANQLILTINGNKQTLDFIGIANKLRADNAKLKDYECAIDPELFLNSSIYKLISVKGFQIIPVTDDRMFEIELIRYPEHSTDAFKNLADWRSSEEAQRLLYSIIHMDSGDATCADKEMRLRLLEKEIDPRWAEYGTLHAATEYSLVCLVNDNESAIASTVIPFITEYPYMISLAISQKLGLMYYSDLVAKANEQFIFCRTVNRLRYQTLFQRFEGRILVPEWTNQEQGVELYHLIQEVMDIKTYREIVYAGLDGSFGAANSMAQILMAIVGAVIAIIALFK